MHADQVIRRYRIADLRPDPLNPRGEISDDDPAVLELADSIRTLGLRVPLLVTPDRLVVDGHRRFVAARLAGVVMVSTIVDALSEIERLEMQLVVNLQRAELTPLQEARAFKRLVDAGSTAADVARRLGLSPGRVRDRLALVELDDETAGRVDRGELPLASVRPLAAVDDVTERRVLADGIAERRVTVADVAKSRAPRGPRAPRVVAPPPMRSAEPGPVAEDLDDDDRAEPREVELLETLDEVSAEPEPELPRQKRVISCEGCSVLRERLIAALDSLRNAEQTIRDTIGEEYVPERARIIRERRSA